MPNHGRYKDGTSGPRRFREYSLHTHLRELADPDLRAGDVLIAKEWSPHSVESFFIPLGQALISHHTGASAASEHVLLVVDDSVAKTAQAVSQGVLISQGVNKRDHVVYGCTDESLRWEAVLVAERLGGAGVGETNEEVHAAGRSPVNFRSRKGAATVLFRRKNQGRGANRRLQQIYDHIYDGKPLGNVRMVCSEFVTTCYEVAAMRLNEVQDRQVSVFNVDPRAVSAKALEALLRKTSGWFSLSGRYRGSVNYTKAQEREEKRKTDELWSELNTYDQDHPPEWLVRARQARQAG